MSYYIRTRDSGRSYKKGKSYEGNIKRVREDYEWVEIRSESGVWLEFLFAREETGESTHESWERDRWRENLEKILE